MLEGFWQARWSMEAWEPYPTPSITCSRGPLDLPCVLTLFPTHPPTHLLLSFLPSTELVEWFFFFFATIFQGTIVKAMVANYWAVILLNYKTSCAAWPLIHPVCQNLPRFSALPALLSIPEPSFLFLSLFSKLEVGFPFLLLISVELCISFFE